MAEALPLLRQEQRRHMLSNGGIALAALAGAFLITNERGVFQPVGLYDSALANAFSALSGPNPLNLTGVKRVLPLRPAGGNEGPGDRGLQRRLTDAFDTPDYPESVLTDAPVDNLYGGPAVPGGGTPSTFAPNSFGGPGPFLPTTPTAVVVPPSMDVPGPVPETTIWVMMVAGFGMVGGLLRRRRKAVAVSA